MTIQAVSGERSKRRSTRRHKHPWLRRVARVLLFLAAIVLLSIVVFRFVNPPATPVMLVERLTGHTLRHDWVPLEDISPQLPVAVIASEDGRFCVHWGVDWGAVREAVKEGGGLKAVRGASTIPMQTAKNLYLWNGRSYVRKALEVPLAYIMTALWPKQRMMEVYLNVAQFGPGIFGAEAASRYYFRKSAADLTRREAVLLAAALPNPRFRNAAKPSRRMLIVAKAVERRMPIMMQRSGCVIPAQ
ncbi:MAG TPA: monofunctional biosynthetic peptidoglycan transglycosylase [Methyloceanibacter sp.]|jgi:monofunctional biosynthetic peptidoglycan transglycosylase|nr:monofunctional biosynthetic peptidoglycan transglycosylase [Methyloceanibacter sp.]